MYSSHASPRTVADGFLGLELASRGLIRITLISQTVPELLTKFGADG
jgi:hypothetical protein